VNKSLLCEQTNKIYGCSWDSFHIFLENDGNNIAFNVGGSLFFNLRYFLTTIKGSTRNPGDPRWDPVDSLDYWYPVVAHEMAHNLVSAHGSQHSFIMESYIQYFMANFKAYSATFA
jgi:hypothetical protein